jgi:hypothetical protein
MSIAYPDAAPVMAEPAKNMAAESAMVRHQQ